MSKSPGGVSATVAGTFGHPWTERLQFLVFGHGFHTFLTEIRLEITFQHEVFFVDRGIFLKIESVAHGSGGELHGNTLGEGGFIGRSGYQKVCLHGGVAVELGGVK